MFAHSFVGMWVIATVQTAGGGGGGGDFIILDTLTPYPKPDQVKKPYFRLNAKKSNPIYPKPAFLLELYFYHSHNLYSHICTA